MSKVAIRTREQLLSELQAGATGQPLLGYMLTWSIRRVVIKVPDLLALVRKYSIPGVSVTPVRQSTAIKRALAALDVMKEEGLITKVKDDEHALVYVVSKVDADGVLESVGLLPEMKVRVNRKAGPGQDPLEFDTPQAERAIRPLVQQFTDAWISRDISQKILLAAVRGAMGINLRQDGGAYFLPASEQGLIASLAALVEELRGAHTIGRDTSYVSAFPLADMLSARTNVGRHAYLTAMAELDGLMVDLKRFDTQDAREKARPDTIASAIFRVDQIESKIALYRDQLQCDVQDLSGKLEAMRRAYRQVLAEPLLTPSTNVESLEEMLARKAKEGAAKGAAAGGVAQTPAQPSEDAEGAGSAAAMKAELASLMGAGA